MLTNGPASRIQCIGVAAPEMLASRCYLLAEALKRLLSTFDTSEAILEQIVEYRTGTCVVAVLKVRPTGGYYYVRAAANCTLFSLHTYKQDRILIPTRNREGGKRTQQKERAMAQAD